MTEQRRSSIKSQTGMVRDGTRKGELITNREGFDRFWATFPRRVGRLAAIKEWNKLKATEELVTEILAGVVRYTQQKPGYADWCHPRTFLSHGRWMDEADAPTARVPGECPHLTRCDTRTACVALTLEQARAGRAG